MTETATKARIDEDNLVDAAARAAEELKAKSLATIRPEQQRWDENQLAILRQIGVEDAPQGDLDLFFHYCRTTGLDPFRRQIYMIGRNTKLTEWVPVDSNEPDGRKRKVERWVTKYTIQTGIDGYRRNGREAAKLLGDTLTFDGPYWCGEDGQWREVWPAKTVPAAAKFVIYRNGEPFAAIAHYDEFVQTNNLYEGEGQNRKIVGQEPNSMWAKMPRNQIAKCAEALAWRRAYPDDFSGLILEDAAQPIVIDPEGNIESEPPRRRPTGSGIDGVRAARQAREAQRQRPTVVDVEPAETTSKPLSQESRRKWLNRMFQLLGEANCTERDAQLTVLIAVAEIPALAHRDALSDEQLKKVVTQLNKWEKAGELVDKVADILDQAAIDEAQAAEQAESQQELEGQQ